MAELTTKQQHLLENIDHEAKLRIWDLDEIDYALSREKLNLQRIAILGIGDNNQLSQMLSAWQKYSTTILGIIPPNDTSGKKRLHGIFETIPEIEELKFELPNPNEAKADLVLGIDLPDDFDLTLAFNAAKIGGIVAFLIPKKKAEIFYPKVMELTSLDNIKFLSPLQRPPDSPSEFDIVLLQKIIPTRRPSK